MQNDETLLPIHRDFTDKEKADWYHRDLVRCKAHNQGLEKAVKRLKEEVKLLRQEKVAITNENAVIKADLKKWDDYTEDQLQSIVISKGIKKLKSNYQDMTANFWRVNDELRELKNKIEEEKL